MKLNISYRENGIKNVAKNVGMSDLVIMHAKPDIIVERCDMIDSDGKFMAEFTMSEISLLVNKCM